ncbi:MAG: hypothetical protein JO093_20510 [Acidobacteria bacterium]|nr:hypothetical protein [Acidobacteriota bacterium]MBV9188006.1 hypothetical protein [Acidobacteriota bacterium]
MDSSTALSAPAVSTPSEPPHATDPYTRAAEALLSLTAFCGTIALALALPQTSLAVILVVIAVIAFFASILCENKAEKRAAEPADEGLAADIESRRIANLRNRVKTRQYLVTTQRLLTLEDQGVGRDVRESLVSKVPKEGEKRVPMSGEDLLDYLDECVATKRVDEELDQLDRYLRWQRPKPKQEMKPVQDDQNAKSENAKTNEETPSFANAPLI